LGTGLKDAVDVSSTPITINILGSYFIKNSAVLVDHAHTITGLNNARVDFSGTDCTQPMFRVTGGAAIRNLSISPKACSSSARRTLLQLENTTPVTIESNDLLGGADAIHATSASTGSIAVRYNHIQGNAGYAIFLDPAGTATLDAVANNIIDNQAGEEVECSAAGRGSVDHNFWGTKAMATAVSLCSYTEAMRLGAAALRNTGAPGVSAQRVTASTAKAYAFNNKIGFQFSNTVGTGVNLDLFIVNHGVGTAQNVPFTGSQPGGLAACSNYWDVFLADPAAPPSGSTLNLAYKYDLSSSCILTIESARFCNQTSSPGDYPLYWYEVGANTWATTGQNPGGQTTTCDTTNKEIQVTINDADGRPNFSDLAHAPFVVGLPNQPAAVVFSSFTAEPGNLKVILHWTTASEINTNGFIVLRSEQIDAGYNEVSDLIAHSGTNQSGFTYTYTDSRNLVNGTTYYYRLKVINLDLTSIQTGAVSVTPIPETATPTATVTITPTRTMTSIPPTATRTRTLFPTGTFIFRTSTPTRTSTFTPTSPFQTVTNTRTPTTTLTQTKGSGIPIEIVTPQPGAATQLAQTRTAKVTEITATATPSPTPTSRAGGQPAGNPLTTVLVIMAVIAAGAGVAVYLLRGRLHLSD
jgi:hypothetical protein